MTRGNSATSGMRTHPGAWSDHYTTAAPPPRLCTGAYSALDVESEPRQRRATTFGRVDRDATSAVTRANPAAGEVKVAADPPRLLAVALLMRRSVSGEGVVTGGGEVASTSAQLTRNTLRGATSNQVGFLESFLVLYSIIETLSVAQSTGMSAYFARPPQFCFPTRHLTTTASSSDTLVGLVLLPARLPPRRRFQPPAGSIPDFRMRESCRTISLACGFSRGSPVLHDLSFRRCSVLTLDGSQELDVKSRPTLFTHLESLLQPIRCSKCVRSEGLCSEPSSVVLSTGELSCRRSGGKIRQRKEWGEPRENPPTNGDVRQVSCMRKSRDVPSRTSTVGCYGYLSGASRCHQKRRATVMAKAVHDQITCFPPRETGFDSLATPLPDFHTRESCRTMSLVGGFSRDLPFTSSLHFGVAPYSPHFTHVGSQNLDIKSRPNFSTTLRHRYRVTWPVRIKWPSDVAPLESAVVCWWREFETVKREAICVLRASELAVVQSCSWGQSNPEFSEALDVRSLFDRIDIGGFAGGGGDILGFHADIISTLAKPICRYLHYSHAFSLSSFENMPESLRRLNLDSFVNMAQYNCPLLHAQYSLHHPNRADLWVVFNWTSPKDLREYSSGKLWSPCSHCLWHGMCSPRRAKNWYIRDVAVGVQGVKYLELLAKGYMNGGNPGNCRTGL
ncbi:hypothetical protein PR048_024041 [Dryococelus australis]|uniref:Uncharacterized protein n=1 Tax=Dryococelus australis TaxID=614101 RepID=A0ABQ9GVS5_9NEOP|nr:hypothetical protein PR048_024041 [Dryococelus australis]